ncbi:hypothetical protein [Faucicola osloensis]|uniref:hypothetical protein n=1 Tax=Faucicola osloensis TaxID=34062 RepID=UPI003977ADBF
MNGSQLYATNAKLGNVAIPWWKTSVVMPLWMQMATLHTLISAIPVKTISMMRFRPLPQ